MNRTKKDQPSLDLYQSKEAYFVRSKKYIDGQTRALQIMKGTAPDEAKMYELDQEQTSKKIQDDQRSVFGGLEFMSQIYAVIGIMVVNKSDYLVCATDVSPVGYIPNSKGQKCGIYIIDNVEFYPVSH